MSCEKVDRYQSRQSLLLNISKWLCNTSNKEQCYMFLEHLKHELNHESIGSLIASLIIKNPSALSNENIDHLSVFCQSNKHNSPLQYIPKSPQNTKTKVEIESKKSSFQKPKCSLLSLSNDCFTYLGRYLLRYEGILLGFCCHRLYQATQTTSFLSNVGYGEQWLCDRDLQRMVCLKADPWMHFVNCKYLTLESVNTKSVDMLQNIMQSPYYTNWFGKTLFGQLNSLTISRNGAQLLSCVPNWVDLVFGCQRLNPRTNTMEMTNETLLSLIFEGIYHNNQVQSFFREYEYFKNKNNNDKQLDNIRKIWMLSCENGHCFRTLSDNIGNILQPNYQYFRCCSGTLAIYSLQTFCNLFHKNLIQLETEVLRLDEYSLMHEIYQIIFQHGYIFGLLNFMASDECKDLEILTNDEIEFIRNNEYLMHEIDQIDEQLSLAISRHDFERIVRRMRQGKLVCNIVGAGADTDARHIRYSHGFYNHQERVYSAYYISICTWMNQRLKDICIADKPETTEDEQDEQDKQDETDEKRKKSVELVTAAHCAQVESLMWTQKDPTSMWYNHSPRFLRRINRCIDNPVLYKLLNWKNSVNNLIIEFVPYMFGNGVDDDAKQFGDLISNIFTHFDHVTNVAIYIKFGTFYEGFKLEKQELNAIGNTDDISIDEQDNHDDNINNYTDNEEDQRQIYSIDDMIAAVDPYFERYANNVTKHVDQYYERLKQRGFSMRLDIFVGNHKGTDIHVFNDKMVIMEQYLTENKLLDPPVIGKTRYDIGSKDDIPYYGKAIKDAGDRVKTLIKHANIRNILYRSCTYGFVFQVN